MKDRTLIFLIFSVITLSVMAENFMLTPKEQQTITNEAENWIDDMPLGMQDRLSDAVTHAQHGFFSEINYFRNFSDTTGRHSYPVIIRNLNGGASGDIPMRIYTPKVKKSTGLLPVFIYFHGGGWSLGSLDTTDKFCRALASEGNLIVISVEYPLAPEHPYPAAVIQTTKAVEYIEGQCKELGGNPAKISLGGDGAGGNLALETFNRLPSGMKISSIVLYYPLLETKGTLDAKNKREYGRGYGFDSRLWETFIEAYKADFSNFNKSLPPTLLISAGRDIIIEQEKEFSGVGNVKYIEFTGALHGFITDGHQNTAFKKAVELTNAFLK